MFHSVIALKIMELQVLGTWSFNDAIYSFMERTNMCSLIIMKHRPQLTYMMPYCNCAKDENFCNCRVKASR